MVPAEAATFAVPGCELCAEVGGFLVWREPGWRVVRVASADFPAFYRVICEPHLAEFTDLAPAQRQRCMQLVEAVEQVLRDRLAPTKINLAALGNMVPHLHWHVIARFDWDSHFPQPVWGERQREPAPAAVARLLLSLATLDATMAEALRLA